MVTERNGALSESELWQLFDWLQEDGCGIVFGPRVHSWSTPGAGNKEYVSHRKAVRFSGATERQEDGYAVTDTQVTNALNALMSDFVLNVTHRGEEVVLRSLPSVVVQQDPVTDSVYVAFRCRFYQKGNTYGGIQQGAETPIMAWGVQQ